MRPCVRNLFIVAFAVLVVSCGAKSRPHGGGETPPKDDLPPPAASKTPAPEPGNHNPAANPEASLTSPKPNASLLFAAVDPLAAPWQASLYRLDLSSKSVKKLLTGESGDPALFYSGGEALFFNRYFDSQNYRRIALSAEQNISVQKRFAGGEIGDPHDALYLGNDRVLLAHYGEGSLVVMRQSTGEEIARIAVDWDLPQGVSLKPEALLPVSLGGKHYIYVVHQALSTADGLVTANGSQAVFLLEIEGDQINSVDLDPMRPRVQGIKLTGSFPVPVRFQSRGKILLVSMCSRPVTEGTQGECHGAIEEVDPMTRSASVVWDLQGSGLYMNGPVVPGPDSDTIFANVDQKIAHETFEKRVIKLSIKDHTAKPVYTFMPESGGFWGSFFDEASKTLCVGDLGDLSGGPVGRMTMIADDGSKTELKLEGVPYSGVFLPSAATSSQ